MKKKLIYFIIALIFCFVFVTFYFSLNNTAVYKPENSSKFKIANFESKDLFSNNSYFLKAAFNAIRKHNNEQELDAMDFIKIIKEVFFTSLF